jgi:beta-N-acetylhexosaminidase
VKLLRQVFISLILLPITFLSAIDFNSTGNSEELASAIVNEMSDEELLAQTFMLGWVGAEPSQLIMDWVRDRGIGGIKIFGWNTDDTLKLAEAVGTLQQLSLNRKFQIPLFIATDQEGGWVRHIKGATSETPGNMAIGASGVPQDAYLAGYYIGRELALLGVNMNFAPTVDLYTKPDSRLIGPRAFGDDPVKTGILGTAFMKGQAAAGVMATAKHFPGHGDTDLDSHGILPEINADIDLLWERELIPYRMLSRENIPAIMSGHLAFPNTPAGNEPASLSKWILTDLLRERIGFNGIIITDDLMMNGATVSAGSLSRAAKQALLAGNDIVMSSSTPLLYDSIWTMLLNSIKQEPEFKARVKDAAFRIIKLKLEYLKNENTVPFIPDLEKVRTGFPDPEGESFFLNLASRSVTLIKNSIDDQNENIFPLKTETAGKILLAGFYQEFFDSGRIAFPEAATFRFTSTQNIFQLRNAARQADTIIFCLSDETDLSILNSLRDLGKKIIVFSILTPVFLEKASWVDGAFAVYSYAPTSFTAGFSAMLGRIPFNGVLPFQSTMMESFQ